MTEKKSQEKKENDIYSFETSATRLAGFTGIPGFEYDSNSMNRRGFLLFVLKGIHHYWTYVYLSWGLKQMEARLSMNLFEFLKWNNYKGATMAIIQIVTRQLLKARFGAWPACCHGDWERVGARDAATAGLGINHQRFAPKNN